MLLIVRCSRIFLWRFRMVEVNAAPGIVCTVIYITQSSQKKKTNSMLLKYQVPGTTVICDYSNMLLQ